MIPTPCWRRRRRLRFRSQTARSSIWLRPGKTQRPRRSRATRRRERAFLFTGFFMASASWGWGREPYSVPQSPENCPPGCLANRPCPLLGPVQNTRTCRGLPIHQPEGAFDLHGQQPTMSGRIFESRAVHAEGSISCTASPAHGVRRTAYDVAPQCLSQMKLATSSSGFRSIAGTWQPAAGWPTTSSR